MIERSGNRSASVERPFVWAGGMVFVGSLALTAWWWLVDLARPRPFAGWPPIALDAAIFTIFALHHSALARPAIKNAVSRVCPERWLRSVYVWTASVLLILVSRAWGPIGGVLYQTTPLVAGLTLIAQLGGVALIALSVRAIDPLELAGIRTRAHADVLQITGPYRIVRHPLYFGWVLIVFGAQRMTGDRLMFAVISTLYLIVAIPWEEQSLMAAFGKAYERYQRQVRWRLVPYLY